jgi:RES domain-containing protein
MPPDWAEYPYPVSTQKIGSQWLTDNSSLCLFVPSVAIPAGLENIIVVNPNHPQISYLKLLSFESELFNKRAFRGIT